MHLHSMQAAQTRRAFQVREEDMNGYGMMHGGRLLTLCDETAYLAAMRHCHCDCLTRAVHRARFHAPLHQGDAFTIDARPALTGTTSIWVACEVKRDELLMMDAVLVFVAVDSAMRSVHVPALIAESQEEQQLMQQMTLLRDTLPG